MGGWKRCNCFGDWQQHNKARHDVRYGMTISPSGISLSWMSVFVRGSVFFVVSFVTSVLRTSFFAFVDSRMNEAMPFDRSTYAHNIFSQFLCLPFHHCRFI